MAPCNDTPVISQCGEGIKVGEDLYDILRLRADLQLEGCPIVSSVGWIAPCHYRTISLECRERILVWGDRDDICEELADVG